MGSMTLAISRTSSDFINVGDYTQLIYKDRVDLNNAIINVDQINSFLGLQTWGSALQ